MTDNRIPPKEYFQYANVYLLKWLIENHYCEDQVYFVMAYTEPERGRQPDWNPKIEYWFTGDDPEEGRQIDGAIFQYQPCTWKGKMERMSSGYESFPREVCWQAFSKAYQRMLDEGYNPILNKFEKV